MSIKHIERWKLTYICQPDGEILFISATATWNPVTKSQQLVEPKLDVNLLQIPNGLVKIIVVHQKCRFL